MVSEFCDDDDADAHNMFQHWRADNPAGFFINCRASDGWMLHRVRCPQHLGDTDWEAGEKGGLTRIRKACSTDRRHLTEWARQRGHATLKECSNCNP